MNIFGKPLLSCLSTLENIIVDETKFASQERKKQIQTLFPSLPTCFWQEKHCLPNY